MHCDVTNHFKVCILEKKYPKHSHSGTKAILQKREIFHYLECNVVHIKISQSLTGQFVLIFL